MMFLDENVTEEIESLERIAGVLDIYIPNLEKGENLCNEEGTESLMQGAYEYLIGTDNLQIMLLKNMVNLIRKPRKIITCDANNLDYSKKELVKSIYILCNQTEMINAACDMFNSHCLFKTYYKEFYSFMLRELSSALENLNNSVANHFECHKNYRRASR